MKFLPDPLHPAIVHFPIVLIVLGAVAACVAVFVRKGNLPWFAAILLTLGAAGAWVAKETGESDGGLLELVPSQMETLVEAHEEWAGRTLIASMMTAVLAVGSAALVRFPRLARTVAVVTALSAGLAAWTVYETGHRGGALVFKNGAGVQANLVTATAEIGSASTPNRAQDGPAQEDAD